MRWRARKCLTAAGFLCLLFTVGALAQSAILVAVEPELKRLPSGGLMLDAKTNLPEGFQVMVTLQSSGGPLLGQTDATVLSGRISAGPFTNRGAAHPGGMYTVSVSTATPSLWSDNMRAAAGRRGERLAGAHVARSQFGNRVDYSGNVRAP